MYFSSPDMYSMALIVSAIEADMHAVWALLALLVVLQTGSLVAAMLGWFRRGSE